MKYQQPFDQTDPRAPYIDGDASLGIPGSIPRAKAIQGPQQEIEAVIQAAGLDPNEADNTQLFQALQKTRGGRFVVDTSNVANVVTVALDPAVTEYGDGLSLFVQVKNTNTGPTTLTLNSLPGRPIRRPNGRSLQPGDLLPGQGYEFLYVNKGFQLVGFMPIDGDFRVTQNSLWHGGSDTGAVNALVVAKPVPAVAELTKFLTVLVEPAVTNTGAATLDLAGLGPRPIVRGAGRPLSAGDLVQGRLTILCFDGAAFQIGAGGGLGSGASGDGTTALVRRPRNISPANGATNVSPTTTLVLSTFSPLYPGNQSKADFQVAEDPDFTVGVKTFTQAGTSSSYPLASGDVPANVTRYWRGRQYNDDPTPAVSDWSIGTSFSTGAVSNVVRPPVNVSPADGEQAASIRPTLTSDAFAVTGGSDTQAGARYQIARGMSFDAPVYDSGDLTDSAQFTSHTIPADKVLTAQLDYQWRKLNRGQTYGNSAWSNATAFRTRNRPDRPTVTSPADGSDKVPLAPTITGSAFSMPGGGTQSARRYRVRTYPGLAPVYDSNDDTVNLTSRKLPNGTLSFGQKVIIDIQDVETGGSRSDWSLGNIVTAIVATPITDLFGIALTTGTNAARSVNTGVDLLNRGGSVITRTRYGGTDDRGVTTSFSTTRGPGKHITFSPTPDGRVNGERNLSDGYGLTGFTNTGFNLGFAQDWINEAGVPAVAYAFAKAAGFYTEFVTPTQSEQYNTYDMSSLGADIGMAMMTAVGDAGYGYGSRGTFRTGSGDTQAYVCLDSDTFNNASPKPILFQGKSIQTSVTFPCLIRVWAHKPGLQYFGQFIRPANNPLTVSLGFRPQFIAWKNLDLQADWIVYDAARGLGPGNDVSLRLNSSGPESSSDAVTLTADGFQVADAWIVGHRYLVWAIVAPD